MNVIKRSGSETKFDVEKIYNAICKANNSLDENQRLPDIKIREITTTVEKECKKRNLKRIGRIILKEKKNQLN